MRVFSSFDVCTVVGSVIVSFVLKSCCFCHLILSSLVPGSFKLPSTPKIPAESLSLLQRRLECEQRIGCCLTSGIFQLQLLYSMLFVALMRAHLRPIRHIGRLLQTQAICNICCIPLICDVIHYICTRLHHLNGADPVLLVSYWLEMLGRALSKSVMCRIFPLRVTSNIDVDGDANWWMGQSSGVQHATVCLA